MSSIKTFLILKVLKRGFRKNIVTNIGSFREKCDMQTGKVSCPSTKSMVLIEIDNLVYNVLPICRQQLHMYVDMSERLAHHTAA